MDSKKLSPVEYVDTVLKAVDKAQPKLNCFRVVMAEEARRDAKAAEEAVMRGEASAHCMACRSASRTWST